MFFTETHQHSTFLRHVPDAQSRFPAIAPDVGNQWRENLPRLKLTDRPQALQHALLLEPKLRAVVHVLQAAAAAAFKMRTTRLNPLRRACDDRHHIRLVAAPAAAWIADENFFPGKCAGYENRLFADPRYASTVLIERLDARAHRRAERRI